MTLAAKELSHILRLLDRLKDDQFEEVLKLVEGSLGGELPPDVLAPLCARMAAIEAARAEALDRLLAMPLQDVVVSSDRGYAPDGFIPETALPALAAIARDALTPDERRQIARRLLATGWDQRAAILEIGREVWPKAAEAYAAWRGPGKRGDGGLSAAVRTAEGLCRVGEPLLWMVGAVPNGGHQPWSERHVRSTAGLLAELQPAGAESFCGAMRVLTAHCPDPALLIKLADLPEMTNAPVGRVRLKAVIASGILIRLERSLAGLAAGEPALHELAGFGLRLRRSMAALTAHFDRDQKRQVAGFLATLGEVVRRALVERDLATRLTALRPEHDFRGIEDELRALVELRLMSRDLGLAGDLDKAVVAVRNAVEAAAGTAWETAAAATVLRRFFMRLARLVELLDGGDAALACLGRWRAGPTVPATAAVPAVPPAAAAAADRKAAEQAILAVLASSA